jgi:uncharacterized protein YqgC (DUF456 family)
MKEEKELLVIVVLAVALIAFSCTSTGYNTQKGAAIGAGVGAIAGQIIGNNAAGTLIGAAGGALAGAIVGNAIDQNEAQKRAERREVQAASAASVGPDEPPPGQWVEVPGQWQGGRWIPTHRVWVPVNPGPTAAQ